MRSGGCEIVIENVGLRPALDIVVSVPGHTKVVAGGLRGGDKFSVGLPQIEKVIVTFRYASSTERRLIGSIVEGEGGPSLALTRKPWLIQRVRIKTGYLAGD